MKVAVESQVISEGPVPKHVQLREILLGLATSELQPDSAVPSERELMARFSVSRATVREAIGQLVSEGRLYRIHGKGTFVSRPRVESRLHLASFTDDMHRRGLTPETVVRSISEVTATEHVAALLQVSVGQGLWRLERLRLADAQPMAIEVALFPADMFPNLDRFNLGGSIYALLETQFGCTIDFGDQTVWAEAASVEHSRHLDIAPGAPLLVFERVSTASGSPVEYVKSWYRADRYQLRMSLDRGSRS